jgi:hypothetical protein
MKQRPMLFSKPMVLALLDGSKTQTRRVAKCLLPSDKNYIFAGSDEEWISKRVAQCPYGQPGDQLWVREAIRLIPDQAPDDGIGRVLSEYAADGSLTPADAWPWKRSYLPPMHCPRGLSRITLEITDVRVERLQDICEEDAKAEGVESPEVERDERDFSICPQCGGTRLHDTLGANLGVIPDCDCLECDTNAKRYKHLWENINGPGSWAANPWVWVVEFKVISR